MGGVRIGGAAALGHSSPPYSTNDDYDGGLFNVWRVINGVPTNVTGFVLEDTENVEEMENPVLAPNRNLTAFSWNFPRAGAGFNSGAIATTPVGGAPSYVSAYDGGGPYMIHPSWGPSSDRLLYIHADPTEGFQGSIVEVLLSAPGTETVLYTPSDVSKIAPYRPQYSPDGTQIAFLLWADSPYTADNGLWVMDADGSNLTQIRTIGFPGYGFDGEQFAWSPDGTQIVFWDSVSPGTGEIYLINSDGTGETQLSVGATVGVEKRLTNLCWSPGGDYIIGSAKWLDPFFLPKWVAYRYELDGTTPETRLFDTNAAYGIQNFRQMYVFSNRIWYIEDQFKVSSVALDGTDYTVDHDISGTSSAGFSSALGFNYP